jgi:hypothetical protein
MKKLLVALVAVFGLVFVARMSYAAADEGIKGVLIDQACCAGKMKADDPEAAAAKHPKACCLKEGCAKSGYAVISGKKAYKFDENGAKLAKEFLEKEDTTTYVTVEGKVNDEGVIAVTAIKQAKKE